MEFLGTQQSNPDIFLNCFFFFFIFYIVFFFFVVFLIFTDSKTTLNDTSSTVYSTGDLQKILVFPVGNFNDDDSYIGGTSRSLAAVTTP